MHKAGNALGKVIFVLHACVNKLQLTQEDMVVYLERTCSIHVSVQDGVEQAVVISTSHISEGDHRRLDLNVSGPSCTS